MKLKFGFTFFCCLLSLGVYAQSASDYLNKAKARLNEGNCESAQRCYNVYKNLSGETDASVEAQIRMCNSKIVVTETSDRRTVPYVPQGYVDLGLPSGTLWKSSNEFGYYNFNDAVNRFGNQLPTSSQFDELDKNCRWEWYGSGFKVVGKNGNYILLQAAGGKTKNKGYATQVGTYGTYWTSESWRTDYEDAVVFGIDNSYGGMHFCSRHSKKHGFSVRLVYNK